MERAAARQRLQGDTMEAIDIVKSNYIRELINKGQRQDSRDLLSFRDISIKRGIIQNAEGSAQVELGDTKILAGVKVMLGSPMEDTPEQGNQIVSAEYWPGAAREFEPGPPSPEAIELARVVDRGIRAANCINLESLYLEEGKCWDVYVDVYVLNHDGNLIDASSMAVMAALMDTRMPKYENGVVNREDRTNKLKVNGVVATTTFAKIGDKIVLDPTGDEENAMSARLTVANDGKLIRAMQKGKSGSFNIDEVEELSRISLEKHAELKKIIGSEQR